MGRMNLSLIRHCNVLAVNNTWELMPWATAMYAGDLAWWIKYGDRCTFAGERWTSDPEAARRYGLRLVQLRNSPGLCRIPGHVNSGGNSGYQAINLAYHFGAKRIILLGFDMHRKEGGHWHGEHDGMLSAPERHIEKWRAKMTILANDLREAGVIVINSTPGSALKCFRKQHLEDALH